MSKAKEEGKGTPKVGVDFFHFCTPRPSIVPGVEKSLKKC